MDSIIYLSDWKIAPALGDYLSELMNEHIVEFVSAGTKNNMTDFQMEQ